MKTIILLGALAAAFMNAPAEIRAQGVADAPPSDLARRVRELEDRVALKALVDTFSILADRKDVAKQVLLFAQDATVESRAGSAPGNLLRGRAQIGQAFAAFLANFETVYHMDGQHAVTISGDRATGTSYSYVVLVGTRNGQSMHQTMGVTYDDEYVRQGGRWLIAKRTSHFTWTDARPR